MIIVADAADIVCGAILLHMTSNFAPHDTIYCNVEQFVMWSIAKLLHICNVEQLVIASHDKFKMSCLVVIYAVLAQNKFCRDLHTFVWSKN